MNANLDIYNSNTADFALKIRNMIPKSVYVKTITDFDEKHVVISEFTTEKSFHVESREWEPGILYIYKSPESDHNYGILLLDRRDMFMLYYEKYVPGPSPKHSTMVIDFVYVPDEENLRSTIETKDKTAKHYETLVPPSKKRANTVSILVCLAASIIGVFLDEIALKLRVSSYPVNFLLCGFGLTCCVLSVIIGVYLLNQDFDELSNYMLHKGSTHREIRESRNRRKRHIGFTFLSYTVVYVVSVKLITFGIHLFDLIQNRLFGYFIIPAILFAAGLILFTTSYMEERPKP